MCPNYSADDDSAIWNIINVPLLILHLEYMYSVEIFVENPSWKLCVAVYDSDIVWVSDQGALSFDFMLQHL